MTEPEPTADVPASREPEPPIPPAVIALPAPPVVLWYRFFCGGMAVVYLLVLLVGLLMIAAPAVLMSLTKSASGAAMGEMATNMAMGVMYALMGLVFFFIYLIGAALPVRSWSWVAGLVLIALSFTSCCCMPAAIPLLIFWIAPETKAWFAAEGVGPDHGR